MCTVTVIPLTNAPAGAFRLVTNRDESHNRAPALAPQERTVRAVRAAWPTDPAAGGTWVAVNECGLALTILNLNPVTRPELPEPDALRSRGLIIPELIHLASPDAAATALGAMPLMDFAPFRMVAVGEGRIVEARWDRDEFTQRVATLAPECFVSSGMGDHLVEPRLALFAQLRGAGDLTPQRQDAFHTHRWPSRPDISVRMERADARTVSVTTIEARPETDSWRWTIRYEPVPGAHDINIRALRVEAPAKAAQR